MIKKDEVLEALRTHGGNEKALANLMNDYIIIPYPYEEDVTSGLRIPIGYALIQVAEGYLRMPYYKFLCDHGYEQFDLEEAKIVEVPSVIELVTTAEDALTRMKRFISDVTKSFKGRE